MDRCTMLMKEIAMTFGSRLGNERLARQKQAECIFVSRDEFCKLMLSYRKLVRSDEPASRLRGLMDVESGERYLIEQEQLLAVRA